METRRFDSDYYQTKYLHIDNLIARKPTLFKSFDDLNLNIDARAFYPSLEPHYGNGDFPFLRVKDVDTHIDYENCVRIPREIVYSSAFKTLRVIQEGDIIITKGGSIARVGLIEQNTAVTRDLIFINSSSLPEIEYKFLFIYLLSNISYNQLVRSSSMTAQPHLTITLVRNLSLFSPSSAFKEQVVDIYNTSKDLIDKSNNIYTQAEQLLLQELNLANFQPSQEPVNVKSFSESFGSSGRLDAEYYQSKFDQLEQAISSLDKYETIGNISELISRGKQPVYLESEQNTLPVLNSKHIRENKIILDNRRSASIDECNLFIEKDDVLINGTGVGTIGRTAPYLYSTPSIPDNHVTIIRSKSLSSVYISVYLNSIAGQLQVEKYFKGSSGQIELYPDDISNFLIWIAPDEVQMKIENLIKSAFDLEKQSEHLLDVAKHAVEMAIEQDEQTAMQWIKEQTNE